jgi:hypothetical protein
VLLLLLLLLLLLRVACARAMVRLRRAHVFGRREGVEAAPVEEIYQGFVEERMAAAVSLEELDCMLDELCDAVGDRIDELVCPITLELMVDPVVASDGRTYERAAIEEWLGGHSTSPLTNLELASKELRPNRPLLAMLDAYRQQQEEGWGSGGAAASSSSSSSPSTSSDTAAPDAVAAIFAGHAVRTSRLRLHGHAKGWLAGWLAGSCVHACVCVCCGCGCG